MTAPERDVRLPERAEALLDGWPAPSRSALEWEDAANAVMARVDGAAPDGTLDDLLAAPLPRTEDEGSRDEPPLEEPGLASIARAVVGSTTSPSRREAARDGLAAAEDERRLSPSRRDSDIATLQSRVGRGEGARPAPVAPAAPEPRSHTVEVVARSELPSPPSQAKPAPSFGAGLLGGAALALAACAALYISVRHRDAEPVATASSETAAPVPAAPAPVAQAAPGAAQGVTAIGELPPGPAFDDGPAPSRKVSPAVTTKKDSLAFRVKGGPSPDSDEKLVLEERDEGAQASTALARRGGKAAPAANAAAAEPLSPGPSLGAVQAALGSVMGGARSCLAGQDEGSKASITFGSDGRVKGVSVAGPAAGTPAESCVRSALMGARVPPFSEPTFSAAVTVRPP